MIVFHVVALVSSKAGPACLLKIYLHVILDILSFSHYSQGELDVRV